jgi:ATP-binding cassette, subfamily B, bacterial
MTSWAFRIAYYARPELGGFIALLCLLLIGAGLTALMPWPLKLIVDHVLPGEPLPTAVAWLERLPGTTGPSGTLAWVAIGTILIFLANEGIDSVKRYLESGLGERLTYALGEALFAQLQRLSPRDLRPFRTGDLVRRVNVDSACVRELMTGVVTPALTSLAAFIAMFLVMWHLDPTLTVICLLVVVPLVIAIRANYARMAQQTSVHEDMEGRIMSLAEQALGALPVIQAFAQEAEEDRRFHAMSAETIRAYIRTIASQLRFRISVRATTAGATALIIGFGGLRVLEGELTVGGLLVFLAYLAALYGPLESLTLLSERYATAAARARRVLEILDLIPDVQDVSKTSPLVSALRKERWCLRVEGLNFGYEPGHLVLHDVSIEVRPGETLALVGPSGSGKSTLAWLIARLFDPAKGRITLDGTDIRCFTLADWRGAVAMVFQEPFLLPMSVADNIAYGRPGASRQEIIAAARAAGVDGFVCRLPRGYDTIIGERGADLSGGEAQRLAIARALLKDAPIVILDEPTSALDLATEAQMLTALDQLTADKTTIVIAHRLSTIRNADCIVVLDCGELVEQGSHQQLLAAGGRYLRFHELQAAG